MKQDLSGSARAGIAVCVVCLCGFAVSGCRREATAADTSPKPGAAAKDDKAKKPKTPTYARQIGPDSKKYRTEGGKAYLLAKGRHDDPDAEWYDFTGSPIPYAKLQYGIGKDRIRAIDDPLFVAADDPRLLNVGASHYRNERATKNDEIMVIGYVEGGEARAYPTALLDGHELVNDEIQGKPVTVGW